ncbi:MAG: bacillithiol biosynthesis deacetylase BshB1 [Deltaproteobacteria bacterium]|nr:bacillithiol biosynthesis deacetylase BshB1 [Deltaproteobacteria bacterium]
MKQIDLLAFGPHPDDVELFCGGTVAKTATQGHTTAVIDLTEGELASRGTVSERQVEAEAASKILGLATRENLKLPDGGVNPHDEHQVQEVVGILRKLTPKIVLLPYHVERHPDHEAASQLIKRSIFFAGLSNFKSQLGPRYIPSQVFYYQMRYEFSPSFIVDTSNVIEKKLAAIQAYSSQIKVDQSQARTLVSSELNVSSIMARDEYIGAKIGVKFGEAFLSERVLSITDPVSHFGAHRTDNALFFER